MFTVAHSDGSFIKKIFSIVLPPLESIPLRVSSEGIKIIGISPDKMIMVSLNVPSLVFERFDLDNEAKLFLEKEDLKLAVKKLSKREKVSIEYSEGDRDLRFKIINPKTGLERLQLIHIREEGEEPPGEIEIEYEAEIQLSTDALSSIIKDVAVVSDEAEFSIQKNKLRIRSMGDIMRYIAELDEGRGVLSITSKSESVVAKYAIDLLKTVVRGVPKKSIATISFGPSKPMRIYIPLEGGAGVTYWVAPRS